MSGTPSGVVIPGVEEPLPPGERLLWHGRPSARAVARHVFRVPSLGIYFAAAVALRVFVTGGATARDLAPFAAAAAVALVVFAGVSWWTARSTVYAITSRRVVMKVGMAMPMTLNLPLACLAGAGLREWGDGSGEIALSLGGEDRFAYFVLWPHARPWRLVRPEPALRGLRDAAAVGAILRGAAAEAGGDALVDPVVGAIGPAGASTGSSTGSSTGARGRPRPGAAAAAVARSR